MSSSAPVGSETQRSTAPQLESIINGAGTTNGHGIGEGPQIVSTSGAIEVLCGPLLNYRRMSGANTSSPTWHGSVLIVTTPGQSNPSLNLRSLGPRKGANGAEPGSASSENSRDFSGEKLYEDPNSAFWRFAIDLPLQASESQWEYNIPNLHSTNTGNKGDASTKRFYVPSASESMRIMFHSCNGFSVGTDVDAWSGCALWNEVLRKHEAQPFHVMIGGGDQIYNDGIRVDGPLKAWTAIHNPHKRREYQFGRKMRQDCDDYYFQNYVRWYSTEPFAGANAVIPQLNIWDDHDIIDGFGSYTDHFMKAPVFKGIGAVAHKYYLLFQHHMAPPASTWTSDVPDGVDEEQLKRTFVAIEKNPDPSYIYGQRHGPYVEQKSMSMYCQLGAHIAFAGIDARTERTRHQINYPDTYDRFFNHVSQQLEAANGNIKHFILLLGVPIAYPRLQWLENILQSPLIAPIKFLNKRFGVGGGLFNQFDGGVDLLDDLDDHYTAHQHKKERKELILRLQALAKKHSIRVTILGGDVHLAAHGRFYSNPKLNIAAENDFRYMPNIVSSAITNKPPPQAVANLLAKRNKIHHLDDETDETLLNLFDKDPGTDNAEHPAPEAAKTANTNHATMPSRNFAIIAESHAHPGAVQSQANGEVTEEADGPKTSKDADNPRDPIHPGEGRCGSEHPAAQGLKRTGLAGTFGLDVSYQVEINQHDRNGWTHGYGLSIPALEVISKTG
ncbi:hypothetical protein FH972_025665 [Carpinus fangiana]|uniref:PhoD-like phosphatase domain-containing protein n=1 Tax=Carpinus fangiana TaxID=176857 RepID=A0A5N6L1N0_9ROSI|nr:hypothetical protein FH972_025665 [Carpinus fangiana]